jgi:hypothetical protein
MKQLNNLQKMFVKPKQEQQKFVLAGEKTQRSPAMKNVGAEVQKRNIRKKLN